MSTARPVPSPDGTPDPATAAPVPPRMPNPEYARSRHAVWLSAAALFTDRLGRVLLVEPSYHRDGRRLLPGGGAEPGEGPRQACRREVREELGLDREPGALPAVNWIGPGHEAVPGDMPFPGEVRYVFDGGVLDEEDTAAIRLPGGELKGYAFHDSAAVASCMVPVEARTALAALRARLGGTGTAHLEDGRHTGPVPALDRHAVHTRPRAGRTWPWHPEPVPGRLRVTQAWGWLFVPDGRVVLVVDPDGALVQLPGGTVEAYDADPEATLLREVAEEAQLRIGAPLRLGWSYDATGAVYGGTGPCARLRLAAPVTAVGPAAPDPATGRTFARLLATPAQAADLLGWGDRGHRQAELAARTAAERWGIPSAPPVPVAEIPAGGGLPAGDSGPGPAGGGLQG
ncbi:NUDIX domain-containing protein [Streptomyces sp. NPDC059506]|uniref:NUDIX domain-containing protein n=1 Tax=Streptomyces sp. NPDC059506 TaxID=3347751 RepID=UPI0036BA6AF2